MNLFLDNIIFSLQRTGGISVLWYELIKQILKDSELNPLFLETPNKNIYREKLDINEDRILNNPYSGYPINIQRLLNPNKLKGKGIFHSSYYRTVHNANIINITTVHDFTYEHFRSGLAKAIHHYQKETAIKNSKQIICVSQNTQADLFKFFPEINPTRVKVIYNGVNTIFQPIINKKESELKNLIDFSSGEYVLYFGTSRGKNKNFNLAVKACQLSNLPLVLVGCDPLSNSENSFLTDKLGLNHYKLLLGIKNDQLNLIYNHALCLLYPSVYEGFGIPIIEAQRAGCPVISTNYSAIPEVAGEGAILLDEVSEYQIVDMLNLIKKGSTVVANLREEGFKNSLRFSWEKCFKETKQVYQQVYAEYISK